MIFGFDGARALPPLFVGARSAILHRSLRKGAKLPPPPRAVVLFSGGLDSTTVLAIARDEGYDPIALTFRYGQRHVVEVERAAAIATEMGADHLVLDLPYAAIGGSALIGTGTSGDGTVPAEPTEGAGAGGIPATYVPARNLVFLSLAVAVAEAHGCRDLYLGVNALDYSGYPDCRAEFLEAFLEAAHRGTRDGSTSSEAVWWRLHAPLVALSKSDIVRRGAELGVDFARTLSCYDPNRAGRACGRCDSCGLRRRGFAEAGIDDPTLYQG